MKPLITHTNLLWLGTIVIPLMLQVKLPSVDRMFAMGVENKATGDSQLNETSGFLKQLLSKWPYMRWKMLFFCNLFAIIFHITIFLKGAISLCNLYCKTACQVWWNQSQGPYNVSLIEICDKHGLSKNLPPKGTEATPLDLDTWKEWWPSVCIKSKIDSTIYIE